MILTVGICRAPHTERESNIHRLEHSGICGILLLAN